LHIGHGVEEKGRVLDILKLAADSPLSIERVQRQHLDRLGENHQGMALETSGYPYSTLPDILELARERHESLFILVLDVIQDPQNLGTLLRTAEAVGIHGIVIPKRRAAGVTPAVVSASSGACEHMMVTRSNLTQAIDTLKKNHAWVIGLENTLSAQPVNSTRLNGDLALVVGSEGKGIRPLVSRSCDHLVRLPMAGIVESLNAAVAGSVVLYLAFEARRESHNHRKSH